MTITKEKKLIQIVLCSLVILLFAGCSVDENGNLPTSASQASNASNENTPYPQWTDQEIANLIPGYQILTVDESRSDRNGNLDDQASLFIRKTVGGIVSHRNNGVQIGPWQLWEDRTITVSTPNPGMAIVDYYPHPYHFNGCIRIWIDLRTIQLPPGRRWDELAFFYVNDSGQLVRYWGQLDLYAMTYSAWPDHFSRYIISIPLTR